jgi:hypothetical protein
MAVSSGNSTSLFAGFGAFAVVVGGLAAYKHFRKHHKDAETIEPQDLSEGYISGLEARRDPEPEPAPLQTVTERALFVLELPRAYAMLGKSEVELQTEYSSTVLRDVRDDSSSTPIFALPTVLVGNSGDYQAEIRFVFDSGQVTEIVVTTEGTEITESRDALGAAIEVWGKPRVKRDVAHGVALSFRSGGLAMSAEHQNRMNKWIFSVVKDGNHDDIAPVKDVSFGSSDRESCNIVGRRPGPLGNGKFFSIGQTEDAAQLASKKINDGLESSSGEISVPTGIDDVWLSVQIENARVASMTYAIVDGPYFDELDGCWGKAAAAENPESGDSARYWRAGGLRYYANHSQLSVEKYRSLSSVIGNFFGALGKPTAALHGDELLSTVPSTPDWTVESNVQFVDGLESDDAGAKIEQAELFVTFDDSPRRAEIYDEVTRAIGAGQLRTNVDGQPMFRASRNGRVVDVEQYDRSNLRLTFSLSTTANRSR